MLRRTEVGEVLARLAREAGLAILGGPPAGTRVSTQVTDGELEGGLRYLTRLACLSYAIRYAQGPVGAIVLQEAQGFRAAPGGPRPQRSSPSSMRRSARPRSFHVLGCVGLAGRHPKPVVSPGSLDTPAPTSPETDQLEEPGITLAAVQANLNPSSVRAYQNWRPGHSCVK